MCKPVLEIAVALVQRAERWLVARRCPGAHLGGLWEFPGGKQRPGESPERAAARELLEECAVVARPRRLLDVVTWEYDDRIVRISPVLCEWVAGEPRPQAADECRWVTAAELSALPMPPANAQLVRAALAAAGGPGRSG